MRVALPQPPAPPTSWTSPAAACWLQRLQLYPASGRMPRPLCRRISMQGAGWAPCCYPFQPQPLLCNAAGLLGSIRCPYADVLLQQLSIAVLGLIGTLSVLAALLQVHVAELPS